MTQTPESITKASDLLVQALEREGVKYIFGVPGEENLDLLESLRSSGIQLILTRHEQGAAFMAAAFLNPDRPVMVIGGDGGFMMNSQELETAVRLKLNLVVLVLNDGSYGMIRWKQVAAGFEDWGLELNNPDFVRYAENYSATGHRIEATEDLVPVFEKAFQAGGVHLIDLPVDHSDNQKVLVDELAAKACRL